MAITQANFEKARQEKKLNILYKGKIYYIHDVYANSIELKGGSGETATLRYNESGPNRAIEGISYIENPEEYMARKQQQAKTLTPEQIAANPWLQKQFTVTDTGITPKEEAAAAKQFIFEETYGKERQQSVAPEYWTAEEKAGVLKIYETGQSTLEGVTFQIPEKKVEFKPPTTALNVQETGTLPERLFMEFRAREVYADTPLQRIGAEMGVGLTSAFVGFESIAKSAFTDFPKQVIPTVQMTAAGTLTYFYALPSSLLGGKTTVGRTAGEFAAFSLLAKGTGKVGSIIKEKPFKIGKYTIETTKGLKEYSFAGLEYGGRSIFLKKPKIDIKIPFSEVKTTFRPFTQLETKIMKDAIELDTKGALAIESAQVLLKTMGKQGSAFVSKKFQAETTTLKPEGVKTLLEFSKKNIKDVEMIYGTFGVRPQMTGFKTRVPHDIDIQLKVSGKQAELFASELTKRLRSVGEDVIISKESPLLIEARGTGAKIRVHAVDIHAKDMASGVSEAIEGGYGYKFAQEPLKVEGLPTMQLSEQAQRKLISTLGISKRGVMPEAHRVKDISDAIITEKVLIESAKVRGFDKLRITTAEIALSDYAAAFQDVLGKRPKTPKNIEPIYIPPSKFPSPSFTSKTVSTLSFKEPSPSSLTASKSLSKSIAASVSVSASLPSLSPSMKISPSISASMSDMSRSLSTSVSKSPSPPSKTPYSPPSSRPYIPPSPSPYRYKSKSPSPPSPSGYISPSPSSIKNMVKYSLAMSKPPSPSSKRGSYQKRERGYIPFVKIRGVFYPITKEALSKAAALGRGGGYVERTPSATFFIREVVARRIKESDEKLNAARFYRRDEKYIERTKFRIDKPGELFGITYKGLLARRTKIKIKGF